ncbi:MAG: conserved membrane protein of unknown function [Candidatus Thorarchaeota archaeon]|nr:MAG: conserved membrane protein of unknown function [Candidatus Thorarchaeota archaeon]
MMKHSNSTVLKEDLKTGFRYAVKNVISFVLGMIGVLIVTGLMMILLAMLIFIPIIAIVGIPGLTQFFMDIGFAMEQSLNPAGFSMMALVMIPFISPIFVAVGALFGMAREIVESEGTTAEGVFTWYKSKFFPLAAGGIIIFAFVLGPVGLLIGLGWVVFGNTVVGIPSAIITSLVAAWVMTSLGLTSMIFPGIIDGIPVLQAVKQSFKLSIKYFDRVFSTVLAFVLILMFMFSPLFSIPLVFMESFTPPASGAMMGAIALFVIYAIIGAIVLLFIVIPAMAITITKVYMILTSNGISEPREEDSFDVSMVGDP